MEHIKNFMNYNLNQKINDEKVTWLIPVKNGMPFLRECLQSIYNQSYKNFEVIIWDNGSKDGTIEELKKWIPNKIPGQLILNDPIDNLGKCREQLVNKSKTELIALIDCDDINHKDRLKYQVPMILSSNKIAGVGSYMKKIFQNGKFKQYETLPCINSNVLKWQLLFRCPIYQPTMLIRKSMVLKAGNYNHLKSGQDYDLWFRLIQVGEIRTINKALIKYRITSNSVSENNRKNWGSLNFRLFQKYSKDFFADYNQDTLNQLWNSLSSHSINKKTITTKVFIRCLYSFCKKNNIDIFSLLRSKILIKQFLKLQSSLINLNFILFGIAILFKNKNFLIKQFLKEKI